MPRGARTRPGRRTVVEVTDIAGATAAQSTPSPAPTTLGELRSLGAVYRPVKAELRANLIARLGRGQSSVPGMVGFEDTVLPEVERALIAGHDLVLLGERGQGKTRLIRTLVELLDEWTPVLVGSELNEHPLRPVSAWAHRQIAEHGDDTPVGWLHRSDRYGEKLATPDTSVGDLIGDVDPIKVAEGRTLGDPETVHYGLVPRTNRGIFSVNELPDLAERIQVALLNVLEERDIQIRGYRVRLPLDLLLVASANPEDYTNRGRIITPLKDRFGAEVRTHYPLELADEIRLLHQEAHVAWSDATAQHAAHDAFEHPIIPEHLVEIIARFTRLVRESSHVDQRSGVSARFAIAGLETIAASAVRRAAIAGETRPVARVVDLPSVVPASRGKVEFADSGADPDDEREIEVLEHLLRQATAQTFRARCAGLDLTGLQEHFTGGETVESGELVPAPALLGQLGTIPKLAELLGRLGVPEGEQSAEQAAAAVEFALEGLYLTRRLAKDTDGIRTVYGA
jgi:magnesium chelatase subunit I